MAPTTVLREFQIREQMMQLARNNGLTARALSVLARISESQARKYIAKMKELGVLHPVGVGNEGKPGRNASVWGYVPLSGTQRRSVPIRLVLSHEQWSQLIQYSGEAWGHWDAPFQVINTAPSSVVSDEVRLSTHLDYDASILRPIDEFLSVMGWEPSVLGK